MKRKPHETTGDIERPWEDLPWWTPYEVIEELRKTAKK